ncbi:amidohydrolase family protein [Cryptosporangium phraense]|uniref:Amidohydrolase family protein n=1 Tax=Cryptosporangium phraense TaxID=2593070 RepID=A0A545AS56_9ACTN|nr:amidohydrolase family protein [Cryptosporangium phraense]TQS44081.1 amidohydrolase family protein [Cryptosporangium phraense]
MIVDAHQHLWDPRTADYPWLEPGVLDRVYTQADVAEELRAAGVEKTVLVQAADNVEDTGNMLREAERDPTIAGVVVWLPLTRPAEAGALLDRWAGAPIVGARHLIHRDPDPEWLLRPDVADGLELLADRGLTFDACAESPALLAQVPVVAAAHPRLRLVLDHLGKPPIAARGWEPWAGLLADAAAAPNVVAKVSGLNTAGPAEAFGPYVSYALEVFGPERLMYGGDWPFALLAAGSYAEIHAGLVNAIPAQARPAVLGGTAERVYRLAGKENAF